VLVNRRLAPRIYLGVAPVLAFPDDRVCFGPLFPPEQVPEPESALEGGLVIDYAVVMVRLPDEAMLEFQVRTGKANPVLLEHIARKIAAFHASTPTNEHIASFGSLEVIRGNWEENFEQMRPYIGRTIDRDTYQRITTYIRRFMVERETLFENRVAEGRIRDCHGDLRLQHVYILDPTSEEAEQSPEIIVLDGIEFNERFRYSDVASEVAFLTMELDAVGRPDLARAFIQSYVAETGDDALLELLPFYACYRACVRGKVVSFQLDEPEVPEAQRDAACRQATALFTLAAGYTKGPTSPTLILVGGLMGTGKSTLALALQRELGWTLHSSDMVRKSLAHLDPAKPQADAFGQGLYSKQWTERTYSALLAKAGETLSTGRSVVLDASFARWADRLAAVQVAQEATRQAVNVIFVECRCPRELALQRLAQRWQSRMKHEEQAHPHETAVLASDGRPDLYDAQCATWQAFDSEREPGIAHLIIDTTLPLNTNLEQVLSALHLAHSV
jgi:aminoglycoside phosphotransferase family enzyme/predicted kinase